ncbi:hypothetical protein [Niveibacterium terrae]|uniref:hypothetical protein n=1 Tax=Niveibacterium terrae TaxID=3373598 RepID=UPI003A8D78D1
MFDEFGQFAEEVLNASGLPQELVEQLGIRDGVQAAARGAGPVADPDDFLAQIYLNQE